MVFDGMSGHVERRRAHLCHQCSDYKLEGLSCCNEHFICSDCTNEITKEQLALAVKFKGSFYDNEKVSCPIPKCEMTYRLKDLFVNLDGQTLELHQKTLIDVVIKKQSHKFESDRLGVLEFLMKPNNETPNATLAHGTVRELAWSEHEDAERRKFWYNKLSTTSTYDKPLCLKTPEERSIPACVWKAYEKDGKTYYSDGEKSEWAMPEEFRIWKERVAELELEERQKEREEEREEEEEEEEEERKREREGEREETETQKEGKIWAKEVAAGVAAVAPAAGPVLDAATKAYATLCAQAYATLAETASPSSSSPSPSSSSSSSPSSSSSSSTMMLTTGLKEKLSEERRITEGIKLSARYDVRGGGTRKEFVKNLKDNGEENWNKWFANNLTEYKLKNEDVWVIQEFRTPHCITSYSLQSANDSPNRDPTSWKLLGKSASHESDWETIHTASSGNHPYFQNRWQTINFVLEPEHQVKPFESLKLIILSTGANKEVQLGNWSAFELESS